jgi:hypothetical protein
MASSVDLIWKNGRFGQTSRRDSWWVESLFVFIGLGFFVVYATWAAFQNAHYTHGPYLSPFYSPELWGDSPHAWFGPKPSWWPGFIPFSPALLILGAPAGFRMTCYYYRGAYYKAFWADPPACAVSEPRNSYLGERYFPLIIQNVHRYFFYLAAIFWCILLYDALKAFFFNGSFGIGLGSIIMIVNVVLLGGYAFGCHSARHLIGGVLDRISESPTRQSCYNGVSCLNANHKKWAWASLISVLSTDIYIRLCSMGVISDWRIL